MPPCPHISKELDRRKRASLHLAQDLLAQAAPYVGSGYRARLLGPSKHESDYVTFEAGLETPRLAPVGAKDEAIRHTALGPTVRGGEG
jgi:hypothetical protein